MSAICHLDGSLEHLLVGFVKQPPRKSPRAGWLPTADLLSQQTSLY